MLHKEFWGLLFLAFVVWIFVAGDGAARIERGCRPIQWAGNVMVSVTALAVPSQQAGVKRWVDKSEYACLPLYGVAPLLSGRIPALPRADASAGYRRAGGAFCARR